MMFLDNAQCSLPTILEKNKALFRKLENCMCFIRWWVHSAISGSLQFNKLRCMRLKKNHTM